MSRSERLIAAGVRAIFFMLLACQFAGAHTEDTPPAEQVNVLAKRIEALERQLAAASAELQAIKAEQSKTASPTGGDAVLSAAEAP